MGKLTDMYGRGKAGKALQDAYNKAPRGKLTDMYGRGKAGRELQDIYNKTHVEIAGTTAGPLVKPETKPKGGIVATAEDKFNKPGAPVPTNPLDLVQPGANEVWYDEHKEEFDKPTEAEKLYGDVKDTFDTPLAGETIGEDAAADLYEGSQGSSYGQDFVEGLMGRGGMTDPGYVETAWQNMQGVDANLNPYYDLAFQDSQKQINAAAAARGVLGSSGTMRNIMESSTRLNAQQAADEAKYKLDRAIAMGNLATTGTTARKDWLTGMGDLAFGAADEKREYLEGASIIGTRAGELELARIHEGLAGALGVDAGTLAKLLAGSSASATAQDSREGRIDTLYQNVVDLGRMFADLYGNANTGDTNAGTDQVNTGLTGDISGSNTRDAQNQQMIQQLIDSITTGVSAYAGSGSTRTGSSVPSTSHTTPNTNTNTIVDPWAPGTGSPGQTP